MDALAEAADRCLEPVWGLATVGFTAVVDRIPTYVSGISDPDDAATTTRTIIAAVLVPDRRSKIEDADGLMRAALTEARQRLIARAVADGRAATMASAHESDQVPPGTPDLDAALEQGRLPVPADAPHFVPPDHAKAVEVCSASVEDLDARSRELVALRWEQGKTTREIATVFDCGPAAVDARERRVRRRLQRALLKAFPDRRFAAAGLDRVLSKATGQVALPFVTRERLRADILKRTFQEEPAPFAVRLGWGLGAAAVAFALWLTMFFGVLPYYDDDVYPTPRVEVACGARCSPGGDGRISVVAPNDARFVAVFVRDDRAKVHPVLTAPGGGPIRLPFGARGARDAGIDLPYPAQWPPGVTGPATVVAVFADERLSALNVRGIASGDRGGAFTSTTAIALIP